MSLKKETEELMFSQLQFIDQHLFVRVFEHAPIGMVIGSPDGKFRKVNPAFRKMMGYSEEELLNLSFKDITHPGDIDASLSSFHKIIQGQVDSYQVEKRYIHKSGKVLSGILSVSLVRDEDGKPSFFISQVVDITEQQAKEEELKNMKELHQVICENAQDLIARITTEGILTYISPAVRSQLGYEPEELIGKYVYDYWHPDDIDHWLKHGNQDSRKIVYRARHKQGHYIWQEANSTKIKDDAGVIQHIIAVCRDITERKDIELRLQESDQRHKSLLKHSQIGICAVNLEGIFIEANPAFEKITGYSISELCSMSILDLAFMESLPLGHELFQLALHQELTDLNLVMKHKNGSRVDVQVSSSPLVVNNQIAGVYILNKDVTEQKRTEERLRNSEKLSLIGELAAGIAHEIRNPLTSLRGFVQVFQKEDTTDAKKLYYDVMLSEIDRINEIVSELLVLGKPSREEFNAESIADKLNQVVTLIEAEAHLFNIEIKTEIDPELPLIICNSSINQVFINILKNAIEAMPAGGEIFIQAKRKDDKVCIRFKDQGCGIPQDELSRIGQPFFTTKETGTGLGLMVSQRIIQNHKGTIRIESAQRKGTTVEILLPFD